MASPAPAVRPKFPSRTAPRPPAQTANPGALKQPPPAPNASDPVSKLKAVEAWTTKSVVGRSAETRDIVLALVAGVNCTFIGPPGTAKTYLVEKVAKSFCGKPGDVFSTMLTKFSKPAEVTGPTDIKALQNGQVRVDTDGFLPTARVGILDEVFKGSSAILNSLLTIANERRFKNGHEWQSCPTRLLIGMSNEFPEDPAILAAFFDRFPIKRLVGYLGADDFETLLATTNRAPAGDCPVVLGDQDFAEIDRRMAECEISDDMVRTIAELREKLRAQGVAVSDRRWVQAVKVIKASAVYDGRKRATKRDLAVLESVVWNNEAELVILRQVLPDYLQTLGRALKDAIEECYSERKKIIEAAMRGRGPNDAPNKIEAASEASRCVVRVRAIKDTLSKVDEPEDDQERELLARAQASVEAIEAAITAVVLGRGDLQTLIDTEAGDVGEDNNDPS